MKMNVLLVDQNEAISFLIKTLLEKDFDTCHVNDGYFAVKAFASNKLFDLVIISIDSLDDDNFQLLQHIKSSSLLSDIPLLVLAGAHNKELEKACRKTGIADYIEKPFDPIIFLEKIRQLEPMKQMTNPNKKFVKIFNLNFYF